MLITVQLWVSFGLLDNVAASTPRNRVEKCGFLGRSEGQSMSQQFCIFYMRVIFREHINPIGNRQDGLSCHTFHCRSTKAILHNRVMELTVDNAVRNYPGKRGGCEEKDGPLVVQVVGMTRDPQDEGFHGVHGGSGAIPVRRV